MTATSLLVASVMMAYFASLTEVIVADIQTIPMELFRDTGITLMGMKFIVTQWKLKTTLMEPSLPEIGGVY